MHVRPYRIVIGLLLALVIGYSQGTQALAVTAGAISGTVTDASANPIAGALVSARAPSGRSETTTNSKGFFVLVGLSPETYTLTVSKSGYQTSTAAGITVVQGNDIVENVRLVRETRTIGTVAVRAQTSLVQPDVTTDSYNVTTQQADTLLGTPLSSVEFPLINSLPGVSNAGGYPLLRGGLENNSGFQIEGITVVDPFFNQFANNSTFNGARTIKVVLGPGDATQGGAGSGYVNEVAKLGTHPAFGLVQAEIGLQAVQRNLNFEYGDATLDNRFSYFLSGRYSQLQAGGPYKPQLSLNDQLTGFTAVVPGDGVINMYYRFGENNKNSIQLYDEKGYNYFFGSYGLQPFLSPYYAYDPNYQPFYAGLLPAQQYPLAPGHNPLQTTADLPGQIQTYDLTKLGYSTQIGKTAFLNTRLYRLNGDTPFNVTQSNYVYLGAGFPSLFNDFFEETNFQTTGGAFDLQKQAGDKNFVSLGAEYKISTGSLTEAYVPSLAFNFEPNILPDFVVGGGGLFDPQNPAGANFNGAPLRVPTPTIGTKDDEYNTFAYITDQFKPTDRLTLQPGLRYESQRIPTPSGTYDVHGLAPKFGLTYALGRDRNTVIRSTYGHSTVFVPLGQVEHIYQAPAFYHNYTLAKYGSTANGGYLQATCGGYATNFSSQCIDYYDQLVNSFEQNIGISRSAFPKAQGSDSYDISLERGFGNNISMKLTSYYRRDYDVITQQASTVFINGTPINGPQTVTNAGHGETFGIDLGVTRQVAQGLSGQFNLTYINQFINYLSGNAFVPTVTPSTLQTIVHPSYLSPFNGTLALDYRRSGWRVNPIFSYSKGTASGVAQYYYRKQANGQYQAVPNTNYFGSPTAPCYFVDPQVPGTSAAPNIVGSLGGSCSQSRNGVVGPASISAQITLSKEISRRSTVGLTVFNLFNSSINSYNNLAGGNFAYVNNGFGAYGAGSGYSQYGPNGTNIRGAPAVFPPGPYFNTLSAAGRSGLFFVNVKI